MRRFSRGLVSVLNSIYVSLLLYVLVAVALATSINSINFRSIERNVYDFLTKLRGETSPHPDIVLLQTRDEDWKNPKYEWPLSPLEFMTLVDRLALANPKVVIFDFLYDFTQKMTYYEQLEFLKRVASKAPDIVFGQNFLPNIGMSPEFPSTLEALEKDVFTFVAREGSMIKEHLKSSRRALPYFEGVTAKKIYVSSDLYAANRYLGEPLFSLKYSIAPIFFINYAGPKGTYPTVGLREFMSGIIAPQTLFGKIVIVGRGDTLDKDHYHQTPFHQEKDDSFSMTRSEIHANIISTLIHQNDVSQLPGWLTDLVTYLVCFLISLVVFRNAPVKGIYFLAGTFTILFLLALVLLKFFDAYFNIWQPVLGTFISYYLFIPYRLVKEYKARWHVEEEVKIRREVEFLKSNFMSLMTHDLKTPIARIHGLTETILGHPQNLTITQKDCLAKILLSSDEFNIFIQKILDFSKIETSGVKLNLTSKDINSLIEEAIAIVLFHANLKEIEIKTDLEPLFPITIDLELTRQILCNLLDNAIKYSPKQTVVTVRTEDAGEFVKISIVDQGVGIPEDEIDKIFQKFYRIKDDRLSMGKGSGLGLYLVKYFVELQQGRIEVESQTDQGSTFSIYFLNQ